MSQLSQEQIEKRAAIQKSAMVWGVIVGIIAGLLAYWLLGGQGGAIRLGGAAVVALVIGALVNRASFSSGAKSAKCGKCGAAFSRSRTDRQETLASSEPKETREEQEDDTIKVTTWVEETFDVVDTYTCAKCGDAETKAYQTTRKRDEESTVERVKKSAAPEPVEEPATGAKGGKPEGDKSGGKSGKK